MADINTGYHTRKEDERIYDPNGEESGYAVKEDGGIYRGDHYTGYYIWLGGSGEYEYLYDSGDHKTECYRWRGKFYSPDGGVPFAQ